MTNHKGEDRIRRLSHWRAFRVGVVYLALGVFWILFSDSIADAIAPSREVLLRIQAWKGMGYVGMTALLLYFFVRWELGRVIKAEHEAQVAQHDLAQLNRELEHRVEVRTRELKQANEELMRFSHTVSHDLRTPLRTMSGFALALGEDYGDKLDDEGRDYLRRIQEAGIRSDQMIDGLMALAKISQAELTHEDVDFSGMASSVLSQLKKRYPDRTVVAKVQPGIILRGDPKLLQIAAENLVGNAWKYTAGKDRGIIDVAESNGVVTVSDNGVGFDPADAERIFEDFERLPGAHAFSGMGIGLATVKRIVDRHGGEIWASGEPDRGASFSFRLGPPPDGPEQELVLTSANPG